MTFSNRMGQDNFVWWMGVVEKRDDPLMMGRLRVRIFGWHTDDLNLIPTDELPWALPMCPLGTQVFSSPMEGTWVVGFFADGMAGQSPIVMGSLPGFEKDYNRSKGFSPQNKDTGIGA
jgi:hypothetical protein